MSDYMAQKADEQIEAGLSERDQLLQRIEELEKRNKAQVELTAEFDDQIGELQDKLTATTQALDAALEALEFYGDERSWHFDEVTGDRLCIREQDEDTDSFGFESEDSDNVAGKRARESLAKIKALKGEKK